jgi:hypothetical protein
MANLAGEPVLNSETSRYLAAFSMAAVTVQGERIIAYHRPADIPGSVDWIGWLRATDAERVVRRAVGFGKITDAANAVRAAARVDDLLTLVRAATQRIANEVETARMAGYLKGFNHRYKTLRLQAQSDGRPFMSYSQAVRKLRGALATPRAVAVR